MLNLSHKINHNEAHLNVCLFANVCCSDDEIEHLATQTLTGTGRASSTPIKVRTVVGGALWVWQGPVTCVTCAGLVVQGAEPGRVHQLAASLSFDANPLARPPGGVPILGGAGGGISVIKPLCPSDHEDISDTESSIHVTEAGPKGFVVHTHAMRT